MFITQDKENTDQLQGMYNGHLAVYPDFTGPNTESWWARNISGYEIG